MIRKILLSFLMILMVTIAVSAQAISNDVRITAGATSETATPFASFEGNAFTANVEVRKSLSDKFGIVNVLGVDASEVSVVGVNNVRDTATLRFAPTEYLFVAGGATVAKLTGQEFTVQPVAQAGLNFNLGSRVNIEPSVQFEFPDLRSDNPARTLSGSVVAKLRLYDNFGVLGSAGLRSTRNDNSNFFNGKVTNVVAGGVYFNF